MSADRLLAFYERIADAPDAITHLRRFILDLAVRGKLVEQDPNDEPVSELLKRIAAEKARLVKAGEIKKAVVNPIDLNDAPFHLPLDWIWSTVGELMHVEMGQSPPSEHYNQSGEGLPFYQGKTDFGPRHPWPRYWCTQPKKLALPGDILISVRAPVGPTNLTEIKCCIGRGLAALKPYAGAETDFALMSLRAFEPSIAAMGFGSTFVAINKRQLALFPFPLPPLAEQRRIVAKVDELMALCDRLEVARAEREATRDRLATASLARLNAPDPDPDTFQNHAVVALDNLAPLTTRLDQIKALRQTILNLAVRGKLVEQDPADEPAAELLKRLQGERRKCVANGEMRPERRIAAPAHNEEIFNLPSSWLWCVADNVWDLENGDRSSHYPSRDQLVPSGIPFINAGHLVNGRVSLDEMNFITSEKFNSLRGGKVRKGDQLYCLRGSLGKHAVFDIELKAAIASSLVILRPVLAECAPYFSLYLDSAVAEIMLRRFDNGSAQPNLSSANLRRFEIPLPPLAEQYRIVAKVDGLLALCDQLKASIGAADTTRHRLLESLLQDALEPAANDLEAAE